MAFDFPATPAVGDTFVDPTTGAAYRWNGYAWAGGGAVASNPIVSPTPPSNPADNSLWWESDTGMLFLRYNDGNSSQWVQINALPNGAGYMPLRGVTDGSDAPAGQIGEVIASNVTVGVSVPNGTTVNVTSISLTAGDWDVTGEVWFVLGTGGATSVQAAISTVSATPPGVSSLATARAVINVATMTASVNEVVALRACRVSLTTPTLYYLTAGANYASGALTAIGNIMARRVR